MPKIEQYVAEKEGRYLSMSSDAKNEHLLTIHESLWLNKGQSMAIPPRATILLVVANSTRQEV